MECYFSCWKMTDEKCVLFFSFFLSFYEWERRIGTMYPFLSLHPLRNGKKWAMKRLKQIHEMSKKGNNNKKKSCHLVPKVVIDLPFEGRKVEGSQECRRGRGPKAGSRREEIVTEP